MSEDTIFTLKKIVSIYLNPITIGLELVFLGIVLIIFSRRKPRKKPKPWWRKFKRIAGDLGLFFTVFGLFFIYACSTTPVADSMIYALEKQHLPFHPESLGRMADDDKPRHVVVLGGGHRYHKKKSPTSMLSPPATARILEGVRIHREIPDATFIVTGLPDETLGMAAMAEEFGVPAEKIIRETESRDTKDHPVYLETLVQSDSFILVTSATHMPRASAIFEKRGLEPILAPSDFWVWPDFTAFDFSDPSLFVPKVVNFYKTDIAFHEHLGLVWAKMRDQTAEEKEESDESPKPDEPAESRDDSEQIEL